MHLWMEMQEGRSVNTRVVGGPGLMYIWMAKLEEFMIICSMYGIMTCIYHTFGIQSPSENGNET